MSSHKELVTTIKGSLAEAYNKADLKRQVQMMAFGLRVHLESLELEKDDKKVTLRMKPCGKGERLMESGAYDALGS